MLIINKEMEKFINNLKVNLGWNNISYADWTSKQCQYFNEAVDEVEKLFERSQKFNSIFQFYTFENFPSLFYAFFDPLIEKYTKKLYIFTPYIPEDINSKISLNPKIKQLLLTMTKADALKIS